MKTMTAAFGLVLALVACEAQAAESKMAKRFDAGPAIQGNSDPAMALHKKKSMAHKVHKTPM